MPETRLHSFDPVYSARSRVLILGTMASPASLRAHFFYGHPQNAFWRLLGDLTGDAPGVTAEEKRAFLLRNGVALWDTLESCAREGALDAAIRDPQPTDVPALLRAAPGIRAVFLNGGAALRFYKRYHAPRVPRPFFGLPSSSPANARGGYAAKLAAWRAVLGPWLAKPEETGG